MRLISNDCVLAWPPLVWLKHVGHNCFSLVPNLLTPLIHPHPLEKADILPSACPKKILPHVQLYPTQKKRRSCPAQESHGIMALFAMATIASRPAGPLVPSLVAPRCGRAAPRPPRFGSGGNAAAVVATAALARSKRRRGKAKPMPEDQVGWGGFSSLKVICELIFVHNFFHIFSQ